MEIGLKGRKLLRWGGLTVVLAFVLTTDLPLQGELAAIRAYQTIGSPVVSLVATCRFEPTCSHYALAALEEDGFWHGNWRIIKRLVHCSPIGYVIDSLQ